MVAPAPVRIRIGRLVLPGVAPRDAAAAEAALRTELARLAPGMAGAAGGAARIDGSPLRALTPAGQGREAAGRIASTVAPGIEKGRR